MSALLKLLFAWFPLALYHSRPDLDGGSGNFGPPVGGGGGGGTPGTPTGSSQGAALPATEVGGVIGSTYFLFMPVQSVQDGRCFIGFFDVSSFDDSVDGSSYSYRKEDVKKDCQVTVNRIVLIYRDLGPCKLTVTVNGSDDNAQPTSASAKVQIGNVKPTDELLTKFVDITYTGFRPQVTVSRNAGDGPFCITSLTMRGTVSDTEDMA